jgi:hypothetical protein
MNTSQGPDQPGPCALDSFAEEIFASLAQQFPVCLASDEFHFFPHYRAPQPDWSRWDDFSSQAVQRFSGRVSRWQASVERFKSRQPACASDFDGDLDMLGRVLLTLREQIGTVCPHKNQPTFYLLIISIGLAEALEVSAQAFGQRLTSLPAFIQSAVDNLKRLPVVYRDLGIEMMAKTKAWLAVLPQQGQAVRAAQSALDDFGEHLRTVQVDPDFRLPPDLYARIAEHHMGCQMELNEIDHHLEQEIEETQDLLKHSAARLSPVKTWQSVFHDLPVAQEAGYDAATLYQVAIDRLTNHCLQKGLVDHDTLDGCDVQVRTIPEHLIPVRAGAAYSMPPGHPPRGGVFYILPPDRQIMPKDMMLLAAHETLPGHHLLDTLRWRLAGPLRRCLEFPVFYEGWACFAEEILFETGLFSGPADRLLMAKRRFWRALRGRADMRIHTGRWDLAQAAAQLAGVGLVTGDQARAMVRRYALKPGYQLAYTIGRGAFNRLYRAFARQGGMPADFVRRSLSGGEVGFDYLEKKLLTTGRCR